MQFEFVLKWARDEDSQEFDSSSIEPPKNSDTTRRNGTLVNLGLYTSYVGGGDVCLHSASYGVSTFLAAEASILPSHSTSFTKIK